MQTLASSHLYNGHKMVVVVVDMLIFGGKMNSEITYNRLVINVFVADYHVI